jgi:peptidoglycan/xylan/chitin deacetylase (PgdA/CDA1 family)
MFELSANLAPIPILVYHQIANAPPRGAPFRSLYVSPDAFARQMSLLRLLGYRGLSMSALLPYLQGEKRGKVCGITFDDGYLNNLDNALPVLNRYGFSSTCYAVSQRLGQTNDWDVVSGIAQVPLMNTAQLQLWLAHGQEVGAHTRHHVHLPQGSPEQSFQEIAVSKSELEEFCDVNVRHFCYPYGEFESEHVAMARRAGFLTATTTKRSRCKVGNDVLQLPRVPVLRSTTLPVFWLKLATAYEDRRNA